MRQRLAAATEVSARDTVPQANRANKSGLLWRICWF